jgi:hypothetical protein
MALTQNRTRSLTKPSAAMATPPGDGRGCAPLACSRHGPGAAARVHDAAQPLCGTTVNRVVPTPAG